MVYFDCRNNGHLYCIRYFIEKKFNWRVHITSSVFIYGVGKFQDLIILFTFSDCAKDKSNDQNGLNYIGAEKDMLRS